MKLKLASKTHPDWVQVILDNFDEFLIDHADCERKASAMALQFVAKCPDRVEMIRPLINLAQEELLHFKQVYEIMAERGLKLNSKMHEDPYVIQLLDFCRQDPEQRFLDRLIAISFVEARGAERFEILFHSLKDARLKEFYKGLALAEKKHGQLFVNLACKYFDQNEIAERVSLFATKEADIVAGLKWRPSLH